jgi:hypothetical protein
MRIPRITPLAISLQLLLTFSAVMGQRVGGGEGSITTPTPTRTNTKAKVVIVTKYVNKPVTPTTGRLFVAAEPDAVLLVEPKGGRQGVSQQGTVPAGRRDFIFNDLKPGLYRVAGTLPGYHEAETEIQITANKSDSVTLNFQQIFYAITINTNVKTGNLMYGSSDQSLTRVEPIQNQAAQLKLPAGKYVVEIAPGEFGYEPLRKEVSVTKDETFPFDLKRISMSQETLSPTWTRAELQGWDMPSTWQADAKRNLWVKGRGVGLPLDARNRYYKDFRLESNVKMTNGVAISFALRAQNSKNYYLLQLTGANADETNVVRLFAVKNGQPQRLRAIPIARSSLGAMTSGQFFNISIKMIDYDITVEIVDSQTGARHALGGLSDADRNFAVGAVGIAARDNEENVIERFIVCTGKCLSE